MSCSDPKYRELQHQLNRLLDNQDMVLLKMDGTIGQKTIDAVNYLTSRDYKTCQEVAAEALVLTAVAKKIADVAGASEMIMEPEIFEVRKPVPKLVAGQYRQASVAQSQFMGFPLWVWGIAAVGGVFYMKKSKKRGRRRKK